MTIGKAMRRARKQAKMTIEKLSEISGYSKTEICYCERDKVTPKITTVMDFADALGISIDEYVGHVICERGRKL